MDNELIIVAAIGLLVEAFLGNTKSVEANSLLGLIRRIVVKLFKKDTKL